MGADTCPDRQQSANPQSSRPMILVCPACHTRYQVGDNEVTRPAGRTVRCANCGHSWHHMTAPPVPVSRLSDEPPPLPKSALAATARAAIIAPPTRRRRGAGFGTLLLVLLLAAVIAGAYFGRDRIVALWPQAARLYSIIGLAESPGEGLDIANVTSTRNVDGLIVEGDITNKVGVPRPVPKLRVVLRDASQNDVAVKIVDPPKGRLLPGETAHFVVAFLPASDAAVGVVVTFVAG
jgi:predicted Zn finger-like uncharacterized protein